MVMTANKFLAHVSDEMKKNISFTRKLLVNKVEEFDYSPEEALRLTIRRLGTHFFADLAKVSATEVKKFVDKKRSLTNRDLNHYLGALGVTLRGGKIIASPLNTTSEVMATKTVVLHYNQPVPSRHSMDNISHEQQLVVALNGSIIPTKAAGK